jgi:hypothetical protein
MLCALVIAGLAGGPAAAAVAGNARAIALPAPTGVKAAESYGDLTVAWRAVSGATGYTVPPLHLHPGNQYRGDLGPGKARSSVAPGTEHNQDRPYLALPARSTRTKSTMVS